MKLNYCLAFLVLILSVNGLYISVSSKPVCLLLQQEKGKAIKFSYDAVDENGSNMLVSISPEGAGQQIRLTGHSNSTVLIGEESWNACFHSRNRQSISVGFDFYTQDQAHLKELALKTQVYQLHELLINVAQNVREIYQNELFQQQRHMIHSQMINKSESSIKVFAFLKLIAIIGIAVAQLFLLKNMLSKSSQGYEPV